MIFDENERVHSYAICSELRLGVARSNDDSNQERRE